MVGIQNVERVGVRGVVIQNLGGQGGGEGGEGAGEGQIHAYSW